MKKSLAFLGFCSLWICLSVFISKAQERSANLLDSVNLTFLLTTAAKPAEVGLENPKSFWKLEYELVLTDDKMLEQLGRCKRMEDLKFVCPLSDNKKLDKKIRRAALRLAKGKFERRNLFSENNREVVIPVNFSPEVVDLFNQAAVSANNPTFVLFVKTVGFTKPPSKQKFKKKSLTNGVHPLKFYLADKSFDYWNVRKMGVTFNIYKSEEGEIKGFVYGI